ncbi:MAG: glycosyl hydrolase [Planctomycetota bacterium]|nr:glycosyl hydrolase [Planctomycetota bacterium]
MVGIHRVTCSAAGFAGRALALVSMFALAQSACAQSVVPAGAGSYYADTPAGHERPVNTAGAAVQPRVSANYVGAPRTNEWWSSLIFARDTGNTHGLPMYPLPLAVRGQADGLDVGAVRAPQVFATGYNFPLGVGQTALRVGVSGLSAGALAVDGAGDWSVIARWTGQGASSGRTLRAFLARGSPFASFECAGGNAEVRFNAAAGPATVWFNAGNTLGVTIGGAPFGLFAPAGATWTVSAGVARSDLAGKGYFSIAALPGVGAGAGPGAGDLPSQLALFAQHAFAFVTDTRAEWAFDAGASKVTLRNRFITQAREGANTTPLVAIFRHAWLNSGAPTLGMSYNTARGEAKLAAASEVVSEYEFHGLVPEFPATGALGRTRLWELVDRVYREPNLNPAGDSYFAGKNYGRIAQLIPLAEQAGHAPARERFISFLRTELSDWFTAGATQNGGGGSGGGGGGGGGVSAYSPVQIETFTESSGGLTIGPSPSGQAVLGFGGSSWLKIPGVDFAQGVPTRLLITYASGTAGSGLFEVRAGSRTGPVLASGGVGGTGGVGTWVELPLGVSSAGAAATGVQDLYLSISSPYPGELMRLDSLRFDRAGGNGGGGGGGGAAGDVRAFAYNAAWRTMIAHPASFGLGSELNDHHFHYGYFIMAAAALARVDPAWAQAYGPMVDLLIRDAANYDRADTRFPVLRAFDPYAGHSYASGHANFFAGNNQESSSESMNFAAACFLWGATTGQPAVRDLGAMLYAVEARAIEQYWFDADNAVYPANVPRRMAGLIWCYGAEYATWFTANPWQIHGINFLPITTASTYLGRRPDALLKNWAILQASAAGFTPAWLDINHGMLALADAKAAYAWMSGSPNASSEEGASRAFTEHWISTLRRVGRVDTSVRADVPTFAAFRQGTTSHRFVWNPGAAEITARFSDGARVSVPPGRVVYWQSPARTVVPITPAAPMRE